MQLRYITFLIILIFGVGLTFLGHDSDVVVYDHLFAWYRLERIGGWVSIVSQEIFLL